MSAVMACTAVMRLFVITYIKRSVEVMTFAATIQWINLSSKLSKISILQYMFVPTGYSY